MSDEQRRLLNADQVRELLSYDPATGVLRWKQHMTPRARMGSEAGVIQSGKYRRIGLYGRYYMAHRLAWLIIHGEWPALEIDHINGIKSDNRLSNLRLATTVENRRNAVHRNRSGLVGASYSSLKKQYRAQIRVDGGRKFLGWFSNPEDAHAAYVAASRKHHGDFSPC